MLAWSWMSLPASTRGQSLIMKCFPNVGQIPNQEEISHQQLQLSSVSWWALRELRKEGLLAICSHQIMATPYGEPWGNSGCENRGYRSLVNWEVYQKNDFSEPRLLYLPIVRKVLTSLIWSIWFSLIVIFWCSNYLEILLQKLLYILAPPLTLLNISSELSESVPSGLKSSSLFIKYSIILNF